LSRISPSDEVKRVREQLAQLNFELKTVTAERDQLKSSLESIAAELNRMSRMAESLLSERAVLLTERNNLLDEVARLTKDRDTLKHHLQEVEGEQGLPVDPGTLIAAMQYSVQKATSQITKLSQTPFTIAGLDVSFHGMISRDGKVVLPSSNRLIPDRLGTISLSIRPKSSSEVSSNSVEMPNLKNTTEELAIELLHGLGATVEILKKDTLEFPQGTILGQDPQPGTHIDKGANVRIFTAKMPPPILSPHLLGERFEDARRSLEREGLKYYFIAIGVEKSERLGRVVAQVPSPGSQLFKERDTIELDIEFLFRPIETLGNMDRTLGGFLRAKGISTLGDLIVSPLTHIDQVSETQFLLWKRMARLLVLITNMDGNAAQILVVAGDILDEQTLAQANPEVLHASCEKNISKTNISMDYLSKFTIEKIRNWVEEAKRL
jgi:hypothetical protein